MFTFRTLLEARSKLTEANAECAEAYDAYLKAAAAVADAKRVCDAADAAHRREQARKARRVQQAQVESDAKMAARLQAEAEAQQAREQAQVASDAKMAARLQPAPGPAPGPAPEPRACGICLESEDDDGYDGCPADWAKANCCKFYFHIVCNVQWREYKDTCPHCRALIRD